MKETLLVHTFTPSKGLAVVLATPLFCALLLWTAGTQAAEHDERAMDRTGFGASGQPTWTALTDYEHSVLAQFRDSATTEKQPDADALLHLYLLASGDVRHAQDVEPLRSRINDFFAEHGDLLDIRDERARGASLLQKMHQYFLRADEHSPLAGYDEDQSRLSELLRTGVYNCISSALLYLVLAETAGLSTAGVIMPSHAFVQVTLADGRVADVETTAADGFDVVRNKAFFDRNADEWFQSRRLVVPSFADYEQRRVVSAAGLGYDSLWSQHTTEARMNYADRLRLAEFRGVLQAEQADAQHNRLVYYYREAEYLRNQNDLVAADQLMSRINPFLASFSNVIPHGLFRDPVSTVPLLLLQAERADWLLRGGNNINEGITLAFDVLQQVDTAPMNANVIRDLAYRALNTRVMTLLETNEFSAARTIIGQFPADCTASGFCINALEQYYVAHGRLFWQQQNWPRTISHYEEYLARGLQTDNRQIFASNLETAYMNQAAQHWFDEERDEAEATLEVCVIRAPLSERCRERLQEVRQTR